MRAVFAQRHKVLAAKSERFGRVVLLGSSGMLGRAWCRLLKSRSVPFLALGRPRLDLSKPQSLKSLPWDKTDILINCAAWTDVDGAEAAEEEAIAVNGVSVAVLAEQAAARGKRMLHYSTDYVFDGTAVAGLAKAQGDRAYTVDDEISPLNAYGRSKAVGEAGIKASQCRALIIRTSWLYAPWGNNFVRTVAELARSRESLKVVNDQRGRPTSAEELVKVSCELLERGACGIAHVGDGGCCTWFDLATEVASKVNPSCRVEPCSSDQYPRAARRPAFSVLDVSATEKALGRPLKPWREAVAAVVDEL